MDGILFKRRIGLWGEGFRWFDLKRLNMDLDRGAAPDIILYPGSDQAWKSAAVPESIDPNASNYNMYDAQGIGENNRYRSKDSNFFLWLFPSFAILFSPFFLQNPFLFFNFFFQINIISPHLLLK